MGIRTLYGYVLILLASLCCFGQGNIVIARYRAAGATPGLVSFSGGPSTQTNAMGARVASSTTCVNNAYCAQIIDPTSGGETIVVFYTYKSANTTAQAPTVTDDKSGGSSTYSCVTEGNDAHATARSFTGICYVINAAAGIRNITVTFPVATNTQGAVAVGLFYNVNAFDVAGNGGTQTASTTYSSSAMTTTVANDLVCQVAVGTTTRTQVSDFGAGTGYTLHLADRRDAWAVQCKVESTVGSITPSMTGQSNAYATAAAAFKAGSSGTAPTGMYIAHQYHYNSPGSGTGPYAIQLPTSGNLFVATAQGGGAGPQSITGITDTGNTWVQCGSNNASAGAPNSATWYAANATSGLRSLSIATTGTGDIGPFMVYDVVGAASSQTCIRNADFAGSGGPATLTFLSGYSPGASSGISFGTLGFDTDTAIGVSSPSGALFDSFTVGAENLDGPYPVDQNNFTAHRVFTDNTAGDWTATFTQVAGGTANWAGEVTSFQAPSASLRPHYVQSHSAINNTSGSTMASPTFTSTAGTLLWGVCYWNSTSQTASIADTPNGTWTAIDSPTNGTGTLSAYRFQSFYKASGAGGSVTPTCTTSGTNTSRGIAVHEVRGVSTLDQHPAGNTGTGTTAISSTTGTTATANEYVVSACLLGGSTNSATSPWFLREDAQFGGNGTEDRFPTSTGTFQGSFSTTNDNFVCLINSFQ